MENYFLRVNKESKTRFWINNVTPEEADMAIKNGATGCTQNPTYVWKMLNNNDCKDRVLKKLDNILEYETNPEEVQTILQRDLVAEIAERFLPVYEKSKGRMGFVSIQSSPLNEDSDTIIERALYNREVAPNIMCKIPTTESGIKAIETLVLEGVPINATECFSVNQVLNVCELFSKAASKLQNPPKACFSLITGIFDEYLGKYVEANKINISRDVLWNGGFYLAKKTIQLVKENKFALEAVIGGARGLHHFTEMVGGDLAVTINWKGTADELIKQNNIVIDRFNAPTNFRVEDELINKLEPFNKAFMVNGLEPSEYEDFGPVVLFRDSFTQAWKKTNAFIRERIDR